MAVFANLGEYVELPLYFPLLNEGERVQLWDTYFHWMEQRQEGLRDQAPMIRTGDRADFGRLRAYAAAFAKRKLTGRLIAQVIKGAMDFARFEGVELEPCHIEAVMSVADGRRSGE